MNPGVLLLEDEKPHIDFFEDYFSDTRATLAVARKPDNFGPLLRNRPSYLFLNQRLLSGLDPSSVAHLNGMSGARIFVLQADGGRPLPSAVAIPCPLELGPFEKALFDCCEFPAELSVLIVDDEHEICSAIREYLEMRQKPAFRVDFALNGLEGFTKIEKMKPDVVILDIKMPVKSGADLYREVRRKSPAQRMIILTAAVSPDEVGEIRREGPVAFLEKGRQGSGFPDLLNLIKKQWIFS